MVHIQILDPIIRAAVVTFRKALLSPWRGKRRNASWIESGADTIMRLPRRGSAGRSQKAME
jgi:hypothetical protein